MLALSQYLLPEDLYPWLNLTAGLLVLLDGASVARARLRGVPDAHHHAHHHAPAAAEPVAVGAAPATAVAEPVAVGAAVMAHAHDRALVALAGDPPHVHDAAHKLAEVPARGHHDVRLDGHEHRHQHRHAHTDAHGHAHVHAHGAHDHTAPSLSPRALLAAGASAGLIPCPSALVVLLGAIAQQKIALGLLLIVVFSLGLASTLMAVGLVVVSARGASRRWRPDSRVARAAAIAPGVSALLIVVVGVVLTVRALSNLA